MSATTHLAFVRIVLTGVFAALLVASSGQAQTPPAGWPSDEIWYLPTADGKAELFVLEHGQGPPVVVVHGGFGAEHSYLLKAVEGLDRSHRFVFYDQRGSLRSPAPLDGMTLDTMVQDLEAVRQALGLERMSLLAHSMGTRVAMAYLQAHPDRVANLVLTGAVAAQGGRALDPELAQAMVPFEAAAAELQGRPELATALAAFPCAQNACSALDRTRRWRLRLAAVNLFHLDRWRQMEGGRAFYNQAVADQIQKTLPADYDYLAALAAHPYPVTVVQGDYDYADLRNGFYRAASRRHPHVRLTAIPRAGHAIWIDDPQGFRAAVADGLARSSTSG